MTYNVNYCILVHKDPEQLRQLMLALDAEWVRFFIHVDKKCNLTLFENAVPCCERVHFVSDKNRVDGVWGDLSLVDAALACMRLMFSSYPESEVGHVVLMSGQDYPLRTPSYIRDYFFKHRESNFMSIYPIPDPKKSSENGGMERLISYTFDCKNSRNPRMKAKIQPMSIRVKTILGFIRLARYRKDLFFTAVRLYFKKRSYPGILAKHFNEFWCAFNIKTTKKLVDVFDGNPEIRQYYQYTHIPDETAFSSILLSDPSFEKTLMPMCHYIDWTSSCDGSPKTLNDEDFSLIEERMKENDYIMYARKFEGNSSLVERINKDLL